MVADTDAFNAIHDTYQTQYPVFGLVADYVEEVLTSLQWDLGLVHAQVAARPKEIDSVVQKICIRQKVASLPEMHDRAGARLVVSYLDDVYRALEWLKNCDRVDVRSFEDKLDDLGDDKVGYLGVHADIVVPSAAIDGAGGVEGELWCEVQIRTAAQSAWSIVSHDLGYKRDPIPTTTSRRFNRLMALAEIIDEEIRAVRCEVLDLPGMRPRRVLYTARTIFGRFVPRPSNDETSARTLPAILLMYDDDELERIDNILGAYAESDEVDLRRIYLSRNTRTAPLLLQPESLLVLERLNHDPYEALDRWPDEELPTSLLVGLALVDGREKPMRVVTT